MQTDLRWKAVAVATASRNLSAAGAYPGRRYTSEPVMSRNAPTASAAGTKTRTPDVSCNSGSSPPASSAETQAAIPFVFSMPTMSSARSMSSLVR